MIALVFVGMAWASELPPRPEPATPGQHECEESVPVQPGETIEHHCAGIIVPTTDIAHLLALESWGDELASLYDLRVESLTDERDYLAHQLTLAQQEPPFWDRPEVQRWVGRIEVGALAGAVVGGVVLAHRLNE
jgi:hypothetical protein